jgi:hypothetical protein
MDAAAPRELSGSRVFAAGRLAPPVRKTEVVKRSSRIIMSVLHGRWCQGRQTRLDSIPLQLARIHRQAVAAVAEAVVESRGQNHPVGSSDVIWR